jgi:hypothetical protein
MDAQESVMEMRRDEPAALVEAAVFSRHRPVAVGCVGLTGFNADGLSFPKIISGRNGGAAQT